MKISDKEIQNILAEVEAELAPLLRSERSKLSKAVGEDSAGSASPMGEESRSPGRDLMPDERSSSGSSASEGSSAGSPMPEGSASGSPEGSAGSAGAPEGSAPAGGEGDVQALAAEYAKLAPEELEMHLMAIEAAMQQMSGGAAGGPEAGMGAGAPPAGGPVAPPAQAGEMPPEGSPAFKSEKSPMKHKMGKEESSHMGKEESSAKKKEMSGEESSSSHISKSEFDALNAKMDVALKAVEFLTRPMRKAVTEFVGETTKPASSLTKGEVTAKLKEVTASPALAKSDRQLVNGFYDGRVSLDQIAHLLK